MKKFSEKIIQTAHEAKDLIEKIIRWRQMQLDEIFHVKYEPNKSSSKTQFEAIMADVNENPQKLEEQLKLHHLASIMGTELPLHNLESIDISIEDKAEIEYKKKLKREKEIQAFQDIKSKR